jgi:hypothetical protein
MSTDTSVALHPIYRLICPPDRMNAKRQSLNAAAPLFLRSISLFTEKS